MQSILHQAVRRLEMLQKQKAEAKGIATPFMDYGRLVGDATLRAMLDSIASAERFVFLESYIFDASQAAAAVKEALKAAAARGCLVILLIDGVGSFGFPSNWISELVKSGVHVTIFNPPLPAAFYAPAAEATTPPLAEAAKRQGSLHAAKVGPLALRDHRKTLVVDGKEAFVGSFNISVDTTGPSVGGTGHFQDLHVRLCGPAATDLGLVFHQSLHAAQAESLAAEALQQLQQHLDRPPSVPLAGVGSALQVLESDILKNRRCIQEALQLAIQTASRSLHLGTAYFMPPGFLRRALLQQIRSRHTDVLLLLSGDSDVWCDFPATTYLAHKLLKPFVHSFTTEDPCEGSGADASVPSSRPLYRLLRFLRGGNTPEVLRGELRIHFTRDKHYHAKNLVADCLWACIGSFNFDRFSSRRNLEVSIGVLGGSVAWELAELQEKQAAGAPQFFLETWRELGPLRRAMCFFAYHIMKFTGMRNTHRLSA
ncbi:cardiolipin synthetase [Cyclospora cayetanensis]|uniref:Cardiolipin synthetase n=1 Tax=Cyclospora cayetanensis TaxID=88456 RepID=A0A1D3D4Z0_9EIME|nr:cardiolipin synthetase [Cyclospora cayetanensis]